MVQQNMFPHEVNNGNSRRESSTKAKRANHGRDVGAAVRFSAVVGSWEATQSCAQVLDRQCHYSPRWRGEYLAEVKQQNRLTTTRPSEVTSDKGQPAIDRQLGSPPLTKDIDPVRM
jgi:hypothetical protein